MSKIKIADVEILDDEQTLRVTYSDGVVKFVPRDPDNSDYQRVSEEYDV